MPKIQLQIFNITVCFHHAIYKQPLYYKYSSGECFFRLGILKSTNFMRKLYSLFKPHPNGKFYFVCLLILNFMST